MARKHGTETGSGTGTKLSGKSIPELISELRGSFLSRDFDRVEGILVAREARLRAELEVKNREIGSLREKIDFERLERINAELELKRLREKVCAEKLVKSDDHNNNGFGLGGEIVVKTENCKVEEVVGMVDGGNVRVLGENDRGVNGSVSLKRNEGDLGASAGGELGMETIIIEDSDEDECNLQATLNKKETTSCTVNIDNDHKSSSGAVQNNLLTGLAERIGNLKRKFVSSRELDTNINALNDLDSDSSSSGSSSTSSGSFNMDLPTSNKKLRADATSLGLKCSQR